MRLPKDDENTLHIQSDAASLAGIIRSTQEKWPGVDLNEIDISAEEIQVQCFGYDLYDSSDYINYVIVTRRK